MSPFLLFFVLCFAGIWFGVWGICRFIADAKRKRAEDAARAAKIDRMLDREVS